MFRLCDAFALALLLAVSAEHCGQAFSTRSGLHATNTHPDLCRPRQPRSHSSSCLRMALTPVGPFCPFRSSSTMELDPKMESMQKEVGPDLTTEMSRVQLDMLAGQMPDPERLLKVADGFEIAVEQWENLITRLRLSHDFQTREYAKLTQAHLDTHGMSVGEIASMIRWQAGCMRAMAQNTPPPMPPPELNLEKMLSQENSDKNIPSITAMTAAEKITKSPFSPDSPAFDSPNVKDEYEMLCRDHNSLIEFGAKYDTFDPIGKIRFLDEIEKIQDRWDVFFTRFKLMGALDTEYMEQCNAFLDSMGMNEEDYRNLLKKCHQMMRDDAEAERNH